MVSLWAGLESLFSPSTMELRFRVSALISSYLHEHGKERQNLYKKIMKLLYRPVMKVHQKYLCVRPVFETHQFALEIDRKLPVRKMRNHL